MTVRTRERMGTTPQHCSSAPHHTRGTSGSPVHARGVPVHSPYPKWLPPETRRASQKLVFSATRPQQQQDDGGRRGEGAGALPSPQRTPPEGG
eukprot:6939442-Pyramimonas_sp.AAC.1